MTFNSTTDTSSIFEGGKLKPGIYKIQNLQSETYLDIHLHSKKVCCRPAQDLEDGRGLVRPHLPFTDRFSEAQKWEITPLGIGYAVQKVSFPTRFDPSFVDVS